MIRNLVLLVAAILGLTTAALAVPNTTPSITISAIQKNLPGPGPAQPTDWTFTVGGSYTAPVVNGNIWQLTGMTLIVVPKDGGRSDAYQVQPDNNPNSWTVTTKSCGTGDYFFFVIASAYLPDPLQTFDLCSAPVFANMPRNSPLGGLNNGFPANAYVSFFWLANPTRAGNVISGTARTLARGGATTDLQTKPVLVVIPKNGGMFFRSVNGSWGTPPAQQEPYTGTASSPQLPAGTQYYTYMHVTGNLAGGTPPSEFGCTSIQGPM